MTTPIIVVQRIDIPSGRCLTCRSQTTHYIDRFSDGSEEENWSACFCKKAVTISRPALNQQMVEQYAADILAGNWTNELAPKIDSTNLRGALIRTFQMTHGGRTPNEQEIEQLAEEIFGEPTRDSLHPEGL